MNELAVVRMSEEERQIFDDVDGVIARAVVIGDPLLAFEYGTNIKRRQAFEGLALAKLLYRLEESWNLFEQAGVEEDLFTMAELHMEIRPSTSKKYLDMWKSIFENPAVPEDVKAILQGRPVGELLLLTAAIREGQLSGDNLLAAALTPGKEPLRQKIKEVRGEQTSSSSAIRIYLARKDKNDMRAGTVYARKGNTKEVLFRVKSQYDELGEQAIARLIRAAGLIEEWS